MNEFANILVTILALATLFSMALVLFFFYSFLSWKTKWSKAFSVFISRFFTLMGFVLTAGAMISTIVFSEVIGYAPCELCWYQRIVLYPQVLLFGLALVLPKRAVDTTLVIAFSAVGMIIAVWHIVVQFSENPSFFCGVGEASCQTAYFTAFGFISMPVMSLVLFSLLISISISSILSR